MYAHTCAFTHAHKRAHTYTQAHARTHTHAHIHVHIHLQPTEIEVFSDKDNKEQIKEVSKLKVENDKENDEENNLMESNKEKSGNVEQEGDFILLFLCVISIKFFCGNSVWTSACSF